MSIQFTQIPNDLIMDTNLSSSQFRVLVYLKMRQGRNKDAWPRQEKIGADLKMARSTVIDALKALEAKGYIKIERPEKKGPGNHCRYMVLDMARSMSENQTRVCPKTRQKLYTGTRVRE